MKSFLSCILASTLILAGCGGEAETETTDPASRPVKLIQIGGATTETANRYPAVLSAGTTAELSFQVGGVIRQLNVSDAEVVEEGDVIASLDARDFESNVASARATFDNAEVEYQRAVRLAEQDAIARNVLEQRKTQQDVAKAQLESAEKALADSVLRAPFSGVAASVPVRLEQTVGSGTTIATVISVDTLDATVNLPASVIAQTPTREDRGAVIILEAAPDRQIEARFSEANLVADATSQTYAVTFNFKVPENLLVLPGMNATLELRSADGNAAMSSVSVPLTAVQSDGEGQFVWVVDQEAMTVHRRGVSVAEGVGEFVVVETGLNPGDQIVGTGGAYLAEGVRVTPWTE